MISTSWIHLARIWLAVSSIYRYAEGIAASGNAVFGSRTAEQLQPPQAAGPSSLQISG